MAIKRSEKRIAKRAEKKARRESKAGAKRAKKIRGSIGNFIVQKRSIVPNMITMSNMTMGFFAIILASRGDARSLALAGILVCIGTLFDAVDGAVARAMHVESPVGVQLDSLADGIAYGIAPAVIAYQAYLSKLPESGLFIDAGMLIALIYPICAIYRLARFNIGAADDDHVGFYGLPSPAAGILVASIPALEVPDFMFLFHFHVKFPPWVFVPIYVLVAFLMVTRIEYSKTTAIIYRKGRFLLILTIIAMILLIAIFSMWFVFVMISTYIVVGLLLYAVRLIRRKKPGPVKS
jgi:CDP-diacylglycerol---serine O-phosphatidyltransferase